VTYDSWRWTRNGTWHRVSPTDRDVHATVATT
jgi:hypothetical protein